MLSLPRTTQQRHLIALTPLIDVVFILLVFFMLASSFLDWRAIEFTLQRAAPAEPPPLLLILRGDGSMSLDGADVAQTELEARLAVLLAAEPQRSILIHGAEGVLLQRPIDVLDRVRAVGGSRVSLALP